MPNPCKEHTFPSDTSALSRSESSHTAESGCISTHLPKPACLWQYQAFSEGLLLSATFRLGKTVSFWSWGSVCRIATTPPKSFPARYESKTVKSLRLWCNIHGIWVAIHGIGVAKFTTLAAGRNSTWQEQNFSSWWQGTATWQQQDLAQVGGRHSTWQEHDLAHVGGRHNTLLVKGYTAGFK